MGRFRFVAADTKGPWREERGDAVRDAIEAGEAWPDQSDPNRIRWNPTAEIEDEAAVRGEPPRLP